MAGDLPSASLVENVRFNATVVVPNALQGLFYKRRGPVAKATRLNVDKHAVGLLRQMKRSHGPGPVWVRLVNKPALLVLSREDIERVLGESPNPFASDPEGKRKGMGHFQPDALTLSRGDAWVNRRRFQEAVLDTGAPMHRFAQRFVDVVREEADAMLAEAGGELDYDHWYRAFRRVVRRIIFGDSARDDEALSELLAEMMEAANKMPGQPSEKLGEFSARVHEYVAKAEPGSLVGLLAEAPSDDKTNPKGQVTHWFFALQDTVAANSLRALALIASHPRQAARVEEELAGADVTTAEGVASLNYLQACLEEAMRLYPTTPMLSRETIGETRWNGEVVPAGTQIVIVNVFHHRDPDAHDYADRFAPEEWTEGKAASDWSFNHFSHGPQGCPGAGMALFVGVAMLAAVLTQRDVSLLEPEIDPDKPLPHMLDYFALRFVLAPRS
jgi:cytochrome P450